MRHIGLVALIPFVIALIIALGIAYGLVYWAIRAETDRSARVGLYLVYGFPGILLFVAGVALTIYGKDLGPPCLALGLGMTLPLVKSFRVFLSRVTPIDPDSPTDMSGLSLFLGVLGLLIAVTWDAPEPDAVTGSVNYSQLIVQMLAWICLAYVVVGTTLRRTFAEANLRLGLTRPAMRTIGIAFGFFLIALLSSYFAGLLTFVFQPDASEQIREGLNELTGDVQNPIGAILIGVSAGVGEELFFRGALQPRFGIGLTALCFALLHTNYGLSFVTLGVFGMGVVLGFERKRYGTVPAMMSHALFNIVAVLIQSYA